VRGPPGDFGWPTKCSAPSGPVPSDAIIAKVKGWLDSRSSQCREIHQPKIERSSTIKSVLTVAQRERLAACVGGADQGRGRRRFCPGNTLATRLTALLTQPAACRRGRGGSVGDPPPWRASGLTLRAEGLAERLRHR